MAVFENAASGDEWSLGRRTYCSAVSQVGGTAWRRAIERDQRFELVDEVRAANPQPSNPDHTVDQFLSTSFIASLRQAQQNELVMAIRELLHALGPEFEFPYWSEAQVWRRTNK